MPTGTKARPRIDPAAHQRLRDAAADALEWLSLLDRSNAVGRFLSRGLSESIFRENQERLAAAIEALKTALEEEY